MWGYSDLMVFPYTILISMQHNGGVLLGAYVNDELAGFVAGYLGMAGAKLYLFSQRMGVLPEYQSQGLGYRLKVAQREQMLRQGIDIIVWTYDPLEGKNATLNIEKLGGVVRSYARDIYGSVQNPLQTGLTTDRFLLEWHLMSDRVRERVRGYYVRPRAEGMTGTTLREGCRSAGRPARHSSQSPLSEGARGSSADGPLGPERPTAALGR